MTSQNDEAEEIMRQVEKEEDAITSNNSSSGGSMSGGGGSGGGSGGSKQCLHLCIINLVIGTLYCSKGNFEFGISRIIKVS